MIAVEFNKTRQRLNFPVPGIIIITSCLVGLWMKLKVVQKAIEDGGLELGKLLFQYQE